MKLIGNWLSILHIQSRKKCKIPDLEYDDEENYYDEVYATFTTENEETNPCIAIPAIPYQKIIAI